MHPVVRTGLAHRPGLLARLLALANGVHRFDEHHRTDDAEHGHVGELDDEIDLTDLAQDLHNLHADDRADDTARQQDQPHLHIDVAASVLGQGAGNR